MQIKTVILVASAASTAFAIPGRRSPDQDWTGWRFGSPHNSGSDVDGGNSGSDGDKSGNGGSGNGNGSASTTVDGGNGRGKGGSITTDGSSTATCVCPVDGGNGRGGNGGNGGAATTTTTAGSYTGTYTGGVGGPTYVPSNCLTDDLAKEIADGFKGILTGKDRVKAAADATALLSDDYFEVSDSINILANKTLGSSTFATKADFIKSLGFTAGIPTMDTLDLFHDCTRILWRWKASGIGKNIYPVQGMNVIKADVAKKQITRMDIEFNSIAWGTDIGWTCTPPPPRPVS